MFYSYNYFKQHNENKEIENYKDFYKKFSNKREFGGDFNHFDHLMNNRFSNTLNHIYNAVIRKSPENLIDIGCGNGVNLPLSEIFPFVDYYGVDYAEGAIAAAKKNYPKVKFEVTDAFSQPFKNDTFDMAILASVLILYKEEEDRIRLLLETKRIIKENGILCLVVWNNGFAIRNCIKFAYLLGRIKKQNLPTDFMACHFSHSDIKHIAKKVGFKVEEIIDTGSAYGALECARYLNMSKFNRTFGKSESQANRYHSQNICKDLADTAGKNKGLSKFLYSLSRFFINSFSWYSIYILRK